MTDNILKNLMLLIEQLPWKSRMKHCSWMSLKAKQHDYRKISGWCGQQMYSD